MSSMYVDQVAFYKSEIPKLLGYCSQQELASIYQICKAAEQKRNMSYCATNDWTGVISNVMNNQNFYGEGIISTGH